MATWDALAGLPLVVEDHALEPLRMGISNGIDRLTTVVRLRGAGREGVGEDVTYDPAEHEAAWAAGPVLPVAGTWTMASFAEHLEGLDLFPGRTPEHAVFRRYRRWAYESAALDLALSQAGMPLHEALGREPRPLTFVASVRLGEPPTLEPVLRRLEHNPGLRFKLDPTRSWTDEVIAGLQEAGAVAIVDLKGHYDNPEINPGGDAAFSLRIAEAFPDAWIEDPDLTPEVDAVLAPHRDRITWDAPLESLADLRALPFAPRCVNVKPSRFGGVRELLDVHDHLAAHGIAAYGGGQFELGPGRGQAQLLASIFHPDTPNDVSPVGFHAPVPPPGLPSSPLEPRPAPVGMRWIAE